MLTSSMLRSFETDSTFTKIYCLTWQVREPKQIIYITVNPIEISQHVFIVIVVVVVAS